jgi:uncharacterized phage protein (TIGR02220 family)
LKSRLPDHQRNQETNLKRFTDTNKWDKPWFRRLPLAMKAFWDFVCNKCDCSGVWVVDLEAANFYIGVPLKESEILSVFGDRIRPIGDGKWWLCGFIEFQYGQLVEACKPHKAVIGTLRKHGIYTLYLDYSKGMETPQEKEKDKEKEKEKDKDGGVGALAPTDEQWTESTGKARIILGYLNQKAGARFSESADCLDPISERLFETSLDVEGCKRMIDRFVALWKGSPKMEPCLRPQTLFGEKFHGYYGQRDMPLPNCEAKPVTTFDLRTAIANTEARIADLKRKHHSEHQGLISGVYQPAGWRDESAKAEHGKLKEELKTLKAKFNQAAQ